MPIKVCCYQCANPNFGMVRHYRFGKTFCKMSCRNDYVAGKPRKLPLQLELHLKPPEPTAAKR